MLRLSAVEIHDVQTVIPDAFKLLGHINRITVDRFLVIIAFSQAHALSVYYIYGRYQFYHNSKKFLKILSPILPLFSGWNWQV